jgi:hypothetical protein
MTQPPTFSLDPVAYAQSCSELRPLLKVGSCKHRGLQHMLMMTIQPAPTL